MAVEVLLEQTSGCYDAVHQHCLTEAGVHIENLFSSEISEEALMSLLVMLPIKLKGNRIYIGW